LSNARDHPLGIDLCDCGNGDGSYKKAFPRFPTPPDPSHSCVDLYFTWFGNISNSKGKPQLRVHLSIDICHTAQHGDSNLAENPWKDFALDPSSLFLRVFDV
jgi:hypothetical protein